MSDDKENERSVYIIPPNFIDSGTVLGGMIKIRNAIEALILTLLILVPILKTEFGLTTKIVIICLTVLPVGILSIVGIGEDSLIEYIVNFLKFLKKRRIIKRVIIPKEKLKGKKIYLKGVQEKDTINTDEYEIVYYTDEAEIPKDAITAKDSTEVKEIAKAMKKEKYRIKEPESLVTYIPIKKIENGIIWTNDGRYVKIVEVEPINFLLRSEKEQRSIIYSFASFLKISPIKLQFKVISKTADVNKHLSKIRNDIVNEKDDRCRELQKDYYELIKRLGSKEAVTRRFFLIFEYESLLAERNIEYKDIVSMLETTVRTAKNFFVQCGNNIVVHDNEDEFLADIFYTVFNRKLSVTKDIREHTKELMAKYISEGRDIDNISVTELLVSDKIDLSHRNYIEMDGVYYSYMIIPPRGYRSQVVAGWLSFIINAGEGIDIDIFLEKQDKVQCMRKIGQQIRINRSKIKETSDTNTDFDDLDNAIRAGYFLKSGLASNEDFYYLSIILTVTASNLKDLEWRVTEIKKMLISQDMDIFVADFRQEDVFLSTLPLASMNKKLFQKYRRNLMTTSAASCYPFVSYEMSDDNGILLGVNKHNNSLVIVDIFNSKVYKNANMSIIGTSGAGKTFTMQLMALRMRRKDIQVFILAPLKGHEFYRACSNIGGEFIQISPASKNCINIMEIRKVDKANSELIDGSTLERSELAAKIQKLHIFFSLLIPDMNHEERQLLDEAIIKTYNLKGITHENESLIDKDNPNKYKEMPILGDLYEVLKENEQTRRLANILNRLVNGSASSFNQQTNVNLDNKYVVIDISELSGDLLTVGMFVGLDYMWDKAKEDRTKEKVIFIDEIWQLIGASSNPLAANYVLEIFKIIRGYGGAAIAATQDIDDFLSLDGGKYGRGILNNSKTKIILNLEEEEAERVKTILHLTETEIMNITHFQRGNGLISTNNNNITVEFKSSQMERELITTDRDELKRILQNKKM